jgi:hypothetical protein
MTMLALTPKRDEANATPWAWFPAAQLGQFVVGPSDFEGTGLLKVFQLQEDLFVSEF